MADDELEAEADEIAHAPLLDLAKLNGKADERMAAMKANPDHRGDPEKTYSGHVQGVTAADHQAISDLLYSDAQVYVANAERNGIGDIAKRKLLASGVLRGDFNA